LVTSAIGMACRRTLSESPPVLRVLLLHNRYRLEGGEERAVRQLESLLRSRGHDVLVLERTSEDLAPGRAAAGLLRGGLDVDEIRRVLADFRADVVHAHNVHPLFGWRALAAARAAGARTVLHVHNFRLFCAIYSCYRNGAPCHRCQGRNTLPGVRLRCRGSVGEAVAYGAGLSLQQPHLLSEADRLVALSDAHRARLVALGTPAQKLVTLPHFVPDAQVAATAAGGSAYALAAGRLVSEKGFDVAIAAARAAGVPLMIAGEGPDEPRLRSLAAGAEVTFTGWVPAERLSELRAGAAVALVPSRWEEPFGYVALDALAAGVPVLVSDAGGLPEVVGAENTIAAGDTGGWASGLRTLVDDAGERERRAQAGLERVRELFGEDGHYEGLMRIYGRG
jgi:glycosyltransferase involved in cell wall biosynthesis